MLLALLFLTQATVPQSQRLHTYKLQPVHKDPGNLDVTTSPLVQQRRCGSVWGRLCSKQMASLVLLFPGCFQASSLIPAVSGMRLGRATSLHQLPKVNQASCMNRPSCCCPFPRSLLASGNFWLTYCVWQRGSAAHRMSVACRFGRLKFMPWVCHVNQLGVKSIYWPPAPTRRRKYETPSLRLTLDKQRTIASSPLLL